MRVSAAVPFATGPGAGNRGGSAEADASTETASPLLELVNDADGGTLFEPWIVRLRLSPVTVFPSGSVTAMR